MDRKDPVLPLCPGRAERHGFEYFRHGTLSLYAAFNTKTGEVLGKTTARHTSAEFVAFLTDIVIDQPRGKEIHVIADNQSAHRAGRSRTSWRCILKFTCTSRRPTLPGPIKSSCGSARSRPRRHRARRIHFRLRSKEEAVALHPALQQIASYSEMEICRSIAPSQYTISWYRPLASDEVSHAEALI